MASFRVLSRLWPSATSAAAHASSQSRNLSMSAKLFDRPDVLKVKSHLSLAHPVEWDVESRCSWAKPARPFTSQAENLLIRIALNGMDCLRWSRPQKSSLHSDIRARGGEAIFVYCDHSKDDEVKQLFEKISQENERTLDILVNNAFSGISAIEKAAGKKFFECDPLLWDDINNVGLRNAYICATYAARMMVPRRSGLIVNVSSAGGLQYFFNVAYGVGKCAMDRMVADMAIDLKNCGVACVSLWPGMAKTELGIQMVKAGVLPKATGMKQSLLEKSIMRGETPEFPGRAVVSLASDRNVIKKSGRILITADLASEYGFTDVDGSTPMNMRNVNGALEFFGWPGLASYVPDFVKVPLWALHFGSYKF